MRLGNFINAHWDALKEGKEVVLPVRFDDREEEIKERIARVLRDRKEKWRKETLDLKEVKIKIERGIPIDSIHDDGRVEGGIFQPDPENFSEYALKSIFQRAILALLANQSAPGGFRASFFHSIPLRTGDRLRKLSDGTLLEDALFQMAKWTKSIFAIQGKYKEVDPETTESPGHTLLQEALNSSMDHFPPELIDAVFFQKEFRMNPLLDERSQTPLRFPDIRKGNILGCIALKSEGDKERTSAVFYRVLENPKPSELGAMVCLETVGDDARYSSYQFFLAVKEGGRLSIGQKLPPGLDKRGYYFLFHRGLSLIPPKNIKYEVLRMEKK